MFRALGIAVTRPELFLGAILIFGLGTVQAQTPTDSAAATRAIRGALATTPTPRSWPRLPVLVPGGSRPVRSRSQRSPRFRALGSGSGYLAVHYGVRLDGFYGGRGAKLRGVATAAGWRLENRPLDQRARTATDTIGVVRARFPGPVSPQLSPRVSTHGQIRKHSRDGR